MPSLSYSLNLNAKGFAKTVKRAMSKGIESEIG